MAIGCCLGFLLFVWEPIGGVLQSFLATVAGDCLGLLRERVAAAGSRCFLFWGSEVEAVNVSAGDLAGMAEIRRYQKEIADSLRDDRVGVIGIYGMAGVGKTTLIRRINNNFHEIGAPRFEVVILVTVSHDQNLLKIQESIGKRIGLKLSADGTLKTQQDQALAIFTVLLNRRFLLLLDDVWHKIELEDLGIPHPTPSNRCKIILTTRNIDVCTSMDVKKRVEVRRLNEFESWNLFKEKVGSEVDLESPDINDLAKAVAGKCDGLPLALITVGRAMADVTSVDEWEEALTQLKEAPQKLRGMTKEVLSLVRFSFDRLSNETLKQCLLYCSLYPEDEDISVEEIIEHWAGEGFIETIRSGHTTITNLKKACLLENGSSKDLVKIHDVVRETCLWLTDGLVDETNAFFVMAGKGLKDRRLPSGRWEKMKRISLMHNKFEPSPSAACPNLQTLLCNSSPVSSVPQGFFRFMPALRVLNLSRSKLIDLPEDIGLLIELRYLNLMGTNIKSLPRGVGNLAKLIILNLNKTPKLRHIPPQIIPALSRLRVLRMWNTAFESLSLFKYQGGSDIDVEHPSSSSTSAIQPIQVSPEDSWTRLEQLEVTVRLLDSLLLILSSERLCWCCREADIRGDMNIRPENLPSVFKNLENIRRLRLHDFWLEDGECIALDGRISCRLESLELSDVYMVVVPSPLSFKSLAHLVITQCHGIQDLAWAGQLPCLKTLLLSSCSRITELLSEADDSSLDKLIVLDLLDLPELTHISRRRLLLPSLEYLKVHGCPQLKTLPLMSDGILNMNIKEIKGGKEWWDALDDECDVKSHFFPYYRTL